MPESGKGLYGSLEDKYYDFLDALESREIPVYSLVDAIESKNIPSFPIFILSVLAILLLAGFYANSAFFSQSSLEVSVQDKDNSALEKALVAASVEGKKITDAQTDTKGVAKLTIPRNTLVEISVTKSGYRETKSDVTAQEESGTKIIRLEKEITTVAKTIAVLQSGTNRAFGDELELMFSCSSNPNFSQKAPVKDGLVEINVPSDCDDVVAKPLGNYTLENETIFLSAENPEIKVGTGLALAKGNAIVSVANSNGQTIPGIDVSLYSVASGNTQGSLIERKQTGSAGTASFSPIQAGKYYVVAFDRQGNYGEYDGLAANAAQDIAKDSTATFAVVMKESVAGKIKLLVRDKATQEALALATVRLAKGQTQITSKQTDSDGKTEFAVSDDVLYNIEVDKQGYLLKDVSLRPSGDSAIVEVEQATIENSESLLVTIVDEAGKPIENARLRLKKNDDGSQVGAEIITGLDGRGVFERVDAGTYYVYAVKPGYGEKASDPITVSNRQQNLLTLKIPLGTGKVDVSVVDEQGGPVAGANVKVVDSFSFQSIDEASTDSDGKKSFVVRADKKAFVIVSAQGFANYITTPAQVVKDSSIEKHVVMPKAIQSFGVELEGLYAGQERISDTDTALNTGSAYTAKLRLLVPKSSQFDEAQIHVRTGSENSGQMEKDNIFITGVRAAANSVQAGTTYTPPIGQTSDFSHLTSGNSKWANVVFKKIGGGVYEVEADLQVRDEAKIGSSLELWYRADAKSGGLVRSPADSVLGTSVSTAIKQGLYANANRHVFSVGPSALCDEDFCASYSIEDTREGIGTGIFDTYNAQIESPYKLGFDISGLSKTAFGNSTLSIKDRTGSIAISSYKVVTALGESRQGQAVGSELSVSVGDIGKDNVVSGEINFRTKKEGTIPIDVSIVSSANAKTEVYRKTIFLKVQPANSMTVDIVPKVIVPLINNNILVRVGTAGGGVPNAKVNVTKNGENVASGETDFEGVFSFTLNSPSEGSVLDFTAEKTGYRATTLEAKVSANVIVTNPATLRLKLNADDTELKALDALILNSTQIPLKIEKIAAGKSLDGYAEIKFTEPAQGSILQQDSNVALAGTIRAGSRVAQISQPTVINGAVIVTASSDVFAQKWVATIPIELDLGFGDELDAADCFNVFPNDWKIFGPPSETQKLEVTVTNTCKVAGNSASLKNLSVRLVSGNGSVLGTFNAVSSIEGSRAVQLDKVFKRMADTFGKDAEEKITFTFKPDQVINGKAEPKIEVSATHFTERGEQKLVQKINAAISINDLSQCIEVLTDRDIVVQSCPYNTGFGNYGSRFSNFGNSRYAQYDPYASRYGYGTGQPPYLGGASTPASFNDLSYNYMGSPYPNSSYSQPFYGGADTYSPLAAGAWNCGQAVFQIRNSCSSNIELSFDAQPGITVKDRSVAVEAGKETDVQVEPTNFFGRYQINIKAKPVESNQKTQDIRAVYVNVTNPSSKNYRDCISLNPSPKVQFNNFIGKPVYLEVINSCYAEGVFLEESTNALFFPGLSIANPADIQGGNGFGGGGYNSPYTYGNPRYPNYVTGGPAGLQGNARQNTPNNQIDSSGSTAASAREMIESYQFLYPEYKTQPNGKVTQVLHFELIKAIKNYRNKAPPMNLNEENPFKLIGGLRYFLTSGYYAVESRTTAIVRFTTPLGMSQQIGFPMILQDWWNALEYAERIAENAVTYGDSTTKPSSCINPKALDFTYLGPTSTERPYLTKENSNGNLFIINDAKGCGTVDSIGDFTPSQLTVTFKNGLVMNIVQDPQDLGHELVVQFDSAKWDGTQTSISHDLQGKVTRKATGKSELVNLKVSMNIKPLDKPVKDKEDKNQAQAGTTYVCKDASGNDLGKTGDEVYKYYGFNNIKYDWRETEIRDTTCDVLDKEGTLRNLRSSGDQPYFCDAVQTSIALEKKVANIRKFAVKENKTGATVTGIGECPIGIDFKCDDKDNMISDNLFRYVLYQNRAGYFTNKDGSLVNILKISPDVLTTTKDKVKNFATPNDKDTAKNVQIMKDTQDILSDVKKYLETPGLWGAKLVLEVKDWSGATSVPLTNVFRDTKTDGAKNSYVGLENYTEVHQNILDCFESAKTNGSYVEPLECDVVTKPAKVTLKSDALVAFLGELRAKGTWKIAARNTSDMGEQTRALVLEKGSVNLDNYRDAMKEYKDLNMFYAMNINPRVYLMKDNYDRDFFSSFSDNYKASASMKDHFYDLSFTEKGKADNSYKLAGAGDYNIHISTAVGPKTNADLSAKIEFAQNRNLERIDSDNKDKDGKPASGYAKNILFSMPFDGDKVNAGYSWNNDKIFIGGFIDSSTPQVGANKAKAPNTVSVSLANTYSATRSGKIISITPQNVAVSFSDPVRIEGTLSKTSKDRKGGLLYTFMEGSSSEPFELYDIALKAKKTNEIISSAIPLTGELCSPTKTQQIYHGLVVPETEAFNKDFYGIAYVPTAGMRASRLNLEFCSGDRIRLSSYELASDKARKIGEAFSSTEGKTLSLNDGEMESYYRSKYNLQNLIAMVKGQDETSSKICADVKDGTLDMYWNPKALETLEGA